MRTIRRSFVLLVAFAAVALFSASTAAGLSPRGPGPTVRTQTTAPIPASAIVPKTAAMLGGSAYPWVQPYWVHVGGVSLARLPHAVRLSTGTQPPAWIPID